MSRGSGETPRSEALGGRCVTLRDVMEQRGDTDPSVFEPLALEVFDASATPNVGARKLRDRGWFLRKLRRECVDLGRSLLVIDGDDLRDPGAWMGYALVGLPRSLDGLARTAGIGLVPRARGRGLGSLLVRALLRASRDAGDRGLRVLAEPDRVRFYVRQGLGVVDARCTWRATGMGHGTALDADLSGGRSLANHAPFVGGPPVASWFVEAWERTPANDRYVLRNAPNAIHAQSGSGPWRALVSRERGGWLVQRLESAAKDLDEAVAVLHQLRGSLPADGPVFLYAGPPLRLDLDVAPRNTLLWRDALLASGFAPAQSWQVLERIHDRSSPDADVHAAVD